MYSFYQLCYIIFLGLLYISQITAIDFSKSKTLTSLMPSKTKHMKQPSNALDVQPNSLMRDIQKSKLFHQSGKINRRDVPFGGSILGIQIHNESAEKLGSETVQKLQLPLIPVKVPGIKPLVKPNETETERAERIHRSFERLLTFVEIVGQVDNYVSSKWKNLVRTVSNFYDVEDEPYHVSAKRIYETCPHTH